MAKKIVQNAFKLNRSLKKMKNFYVYLNALIVITLKIESVNNVQQIVNFVKIVKNVRYAKKNMN